jgi:hypothetical protein
VSTYRLPCSCLVERGAERIVEFCAEHAKQFDEIHARAVTDHADGHPRALKPGGMPVNEFQSNIRTAVHP